MAQAAGLDGVFDGGSSAAIKYTCEVLSEVLGCNISEGTLYNAREQCFTQLEPVEAQLKAGVEAAAVAYFDETGLR